MMPDRRAAGALVFALLSGVAHAQTDQPQTPSPVVASPAPLPDLTVTATGIAAPLFAVPAAVSAVEQDWLAARGAATTLTAIETTPGLVVSSAPATSGRLALTLRGLGDASGANPAATTFLDGVPLPAAATDMLLFDTSQVSVTRGSDTLVSGLGGSAGSIHIATARPGTRLGGYGEFAAGAFGRRLARGGLDVPLASGIALALEGVIQNDTGWLTNTRTGETLNNANMGGLRLALALAPTAGLNWRLSAAYMRNDAANSAASPCDSLAPVRCGGRFAVTGLSAADPLRGSPFAGTRDPVIGLAIDAGGAKALRGLGTRTETQFYASNLAWGDSRLKLTLTSAAIVTTQRGAMDLADGRSLPALAPQPWPRGGRAQLADDRTRQLSQEVRVEAQLSPALQLAGGGLWLDARTSRDRADLAGPDLLLADRRLDVSRRHVSAWAQAVLAPLAGVTVSAGVRHVDEDQTLRIGDNRTFCAAGGPRCLDMANVTTAGVPLSQSLSLWAPQASVAVTLGKQTLWASAGRGYRPAGWNEDALTAADLRPVGAETAWTWQAGMKGALTAARLRYALTGFALRADDVQQAGGRIDPFTGWATLVRANAERLDNFGIEAEVAWTPLDRLHLWGQGGWQRPRLAGTTLRPVLAPALTATAGASWDYVVPMAGIVLSPRAELMWRSRMETAIDNAPGTAAPAALQVGAALQARTDDGNWLISVECRNCLDADVVQTGLFGLSYLAPPRLWQLRLRRVF